jgi:guanylate cyclase
MSLNLTSTNVQLYRDPNLLPGRKLCYMIDDTGLPDTADAMRAMSQMRDMGVKAFVGLEHSCAQEAMLAAAWDIPLVSYVSINILH